MLIPVTEIEGDRVFRHPNGHVLVRVNDEVSISFRTEAALDVVLEAIDRERAPGRDPWMTRRDYEESWADDVYERDLAGF